MKARAELKDIIDQISIADSPVGMDAVYVHALILDKLAHIEGRLRDLERPQMGVEKIAHPAGHESANR